MKINTMRTKIPCPNKGFEKEENWVFLLVESQEITDTNTGFIQGMRDNIHPDMSSKVRILHPRVRDDIFLEGCKVFY